MSGAVVKRTKAELALGRELCEQMDLFRKINEKAVAHGRPVPYPELYIAVSTMRVVKRGGGYVVVMRKDILDVRDADLNEHGKSATSGRSFTQRVHFGDAGRGRYNDERRLEVGGDLLNDPENIERKEHAAFGSACL